MDQRTPTLAFHPLAEVLPLMEGEEFAQLVASVKERGLDDPIVVYENAILDGRSRYRACLEAGIEPQVINFNGRSPELFVLDHNLDRRHLTNEQKREMAEKILKMNPERSDCLIATLLKSSRSRVSRIRKILELRGSLKPAEKRIAKNGSLHPAKSGGGGGWPRGKPRGMTMKRKHGIFQRSLSLFCNYAESLEDLPMPQLDDAQRKHAVNRILEAQRLIRKFKDRINGEVK